MRGSVGGHLGETAPTSIRITVTPLNIPARFRRRDVRSDDAARQPAALLTLAPTPAPAPNGSPACPSAATSMIRTCQGKTHISSGLSEGFPARLQSSLG